MRIESEKRSSPAGPSWRQRWAGILGGLLTGAGVSTVLSLVMEGRVTLVSAVVAIALTTAGISLLALEIEDTRRFERRISPWPLRKNGASKSSLPEDAYEVARRTFFAVAPRPLRQDDRRLPTREELHDRADLR